MATATAAGPGRRRPRPHRPRPLAVLEARRKAGGASDGQTPAAVPGAGAAADRSATPAGPPPLEAVRPNPVPALLAAARGDDALRARTAFAELVALANAWRDPATRDRSVAAADALKTLRSGDTRFVGRAAAALDIRERAVRGALEAGGVKWRSAQSTTGDRGPERRLSVSVSRPAPTPGRPPAPPRRSWFDPATGRRVVTPRPLPDGPHPLTLLSLLEPDPIPLHVDLSPNAAPLTRARFVELCALPRLVSLTLNEQEYFEEDWLARLRNHPTLRSLTFTDVPITADGCTVLATIPNLRWLSLSGCPIGDDGLRALADAPALRGFNLTGAGLTDDGLRAFADRWAADGRGEFSVGSLADNLITDDGFTALPVTAAGGINLSDTGCGDASVAFLLERWIARFDARGEDADPIGITLDGSAVTDAGLATLAAVPRIGRLHLNRTRVTGRGFDAFAAAGTPLPASIELTDSAFDDAGCRALAGCREPDRLTLDCEGTRVTDAGLVHLGTLEKLKSLTVGGPHVTDAGLAALAGCGELGSLTVTDGPVTGTGLAALAGTVPLSSVTLPKESITDAGRAVAELFPELRAINAR